MTIRHLTRQLLVGVLLAVLLAVLQIVLFAAPAAQGKAGAPLTGEAALAAAKPGRLATQPIDEEYTKKIKEYTTETFFLSPVIDYMPASKTVPTPKAMAEANAVIAKAAALSATLAKHKVTLAAPAPVKLPAALAAGTKK